MPKALIYSDKSSLAGQLVSCAKENGYDVLALAFSEQDAQALVTSGASGILHVAGDNPRPESYASEVAKLISQNNATLFLVGATARGRELAAMVAGYLNWPMANDVLSMELTEDGICAKRMMYGGAVVRAERYPNAGVIVLPEGRYEAVSGGSAAIEVVPAKGDNRVCFQSLEPMPASDSGGLTSAERVITIGLGLGSEEGLVPVRELAKALDAELGCTRPAAEERHWLDSSRYIGISNLSIKPKLCLALGVSGQVQHVVGVRESKIIVGVNNDEKAAIFRSTDYGIVGDLYEFIPEMIRVLEGT